jgi:hypothetical protein
MPKVSGFWGIIPIKGFFAGLVPRILKVSGLWGTRSKDSLQDLCPGYSWLVYLLSRRSKGSLQARAWIWIPLPVLIGGFFAVLVPWTCSTCTCTCTCTSGYLYSMLVIFWYPSSKGSLSDLCPGDRSGFSDLWIRILNRNPLALKRQEKKMYFC